MNSKIIINRAGRIYINIDATKKNIFGDMEGILYVSARLKEIVLKTGYTVKLSENKKSYDIIKKEV